MKHKNWVNIFFIFILSCVVLLYTFIFCGRMVYEYWEYANNPAHNYLITSNTNYDLVVLGDSKTKAAFLPGMLKGKKSVNFAIGGSTAFGNYLTFKTYLKHNPPPKKILISLFAGHLEEADCFWGRGVKFGTIPYCEYKKLAKSFNETPNKENIKQSFWGYKLNPKTYVPSFKETFKGKFKRYGENIKALNYLIENHGHMFFGRQNEATGLEIDKKDFVPSKTLTYYLEKIITLALQNNIEIYYYHTPFNEATYDALTNNWKKSYHEFFDKFKRKYPSVKFINDFPERYKNTMFGDNSHLYKGVYKATENIIMKIYKDKKFIDYDFKIKHQKKYMK